MDSSHKIDNSSTHINIWDVPVIVFVVSAIALPVYLVLTDRFQSMTTLIKFIDASVGILGNLYLLIWATRGRGVNSILWNWLPPFWPIGKIFNSSEARLILVLLIVLGSTIGFLSEFGILNIAPR